MDLDVSFLFGSLILDILWRRSLRKRGWTQERIRQLEWRIALVVFIAIALGFIGLVASYS